MKCWCVEDWFFDDDDLKVKLSIKENTYFRILNTYFTYKARRGFAEFKLHAYVFANSKEDAEKQLKHACFFLSYIFGVNIDLYNSFIKLDNKNENDLLNETSLNSGKLKKLQLLSNQISSISEVKKEYFFNCSECYLYALSLNKNRLYNEEFLVLFRIFESVSKIFYNDVGKNKLKHNFSETNSKDVLSDYICTYFKVKVRKKDLDRFHNIIIKQIKDDMLYKLVYIFEYYGICYDYSTIEEIVKLRNDMTHMNSYSITEEHLYNLISTETILVRRLINKIYFNKNTFKALMIAKVEEY